MGDGHSFKRSVPLPEIQNAPRIPLLRALLLIVKVVIAVFLVIMSDLKDGIWNVLKYLVFALVFGPIYSLLCIILYLLSFPWKTYPPPQPNHHSIIVITGCDSGIGKTTALYLLSKGFHVICGVLTNEGGRNLQQEWDNICYNNNNNNDDSKKRNNNSQQGDNDNNNAVYPPSSHHHHHHHHKGRGKLSIGIVDITSDLSVGEFAQGVGLHLTSHPSNRLVGLVNNAGIILPGPIELQPLSQVITQMDVNLIGHIRMIKALLPAIRSSRGRIVNISSIAGRVNAKLMTSYNASKHAIEALTHSLRIELLRFGVSVSAIEPGFVNTPLIEGVSGGNQSRIWDGLSPLNKEVYEKERYQFYKSTEKFKLIATPPIRVSECIYHALTSRRPKTRYLVGLDAKILAFISWSLGDRLSDAFFTLFESFI